MSVDVLKSKFAKYRYNNLLEKFFFVKTNITKKDKETNLDRWLLIELIENNPDLNTDKIRII